MVAVGAVHLAGLYIILFISCYNIVSISMNVIAAGAVHMARLQRRRLRCEETPGIRLWQSQARILAKQFKANQYLPQ